MNASTVHYKTADGPACGASITARQTVDPGTVDCPDCRRILNREHPPKRDGIWGLA